MHTTHLEEARGVDTGVAKRREVSGSQCAAYSERRQRYSQCLLGLVVVGVEPVRRELLDVGFGQAARFGLAQALGQVQQGLGG